MTTILLGTLAYCLVTFPYAYVWHLVLFKKKYAAWEYFGGTPLPLLGLLSMVIQGLVLSAALKLFPLGLSTVALTAFIGLAFAFHWSTHVLAAMAKSSRTRTVGFLGLETVYLIGQFAAFGLLASVIFG